MAPRVREGRLRLDRSRRARGRRALRRGARPRAWRGDHCPAAHGARRTPVGAGGGVRALADRARRRRFPGGPRARSRGRPLRRRPRPSSPCTSRPGAARSPGRSGGRASRRTSIQAWANCRFRRSRRGHVMAVLQPIWNTKRGDGPAGEAAHLGDLSLGRGAGTPHGRSRGDRDRCGPAPQRFGAAAHAGAAVRRGCGLASPG